MLKLKQAIENYHPTEQALSCPSYPAKVPTPNRDRIRRMVKSRSRSASSTGGGRNSGTWSTWSVETMGGMRGTRGMGGTVGIGDKDDTTPTRDVYGGGSIADTTKEDQEIEVEDTTIEASSGSDIDRDKSAVCASQSSIGRSVFEYEDDSDENRVDTSILDGVSDENRGSSKGEGNGNGSSRDKDSGRDRDSGSGRDRDSGSGSGRDRDRGSGSGRDRGSGSGRDRDSGSGSGSTDINDPPSMTSSGRHRDNSLCLEATLNSLSCSRQLDSSSLPSSADAIPTHSHSSLPSLSSLATEGMRLTTEEMSPPSFVPLEGIEPPTQQSNSIDSYARMEQYEQSRLLLESAAYEFSSSPSSSRNTSIASSRESLVACDQRQDTAIGDIGGI